MKKFLLILPFLLFGCNQNDLNDDFRKVVIDYQKKFPIPSSTKRKRIFVYHATFYKEKQDTMFLLSRVGSGINEKYFKGYGVYQDEELKTFVVIDSSNLSHKFVNTKKREFPAELEWKGFNTPEGCTPLYRYKVKNKKIELVTIDTIWMHWE